jgi:hypothetical protein
LRTQWLKKGLLTSTDNSTNPTAGISSNQQKSALIPQSMFKSVLPDVKHEEKETKAKRPT